MHRFRVPAAARPVPAGLAVVATLVIATLALAALAPARAAAQQTEADAENAASLDVYAFGQADDGGNELARESFEYVGARVALKLKADQFVTVRGRATTALVNNPNPPDLPSTILNAASTSASADLVTLDSSITLDIRPDGATGDLTISPGIYYHHQLNLISGGGDLSLRQELFDGDTVLLLSYTFRFDYIERDTWDGDFDGDDQRISHNLQLNWQQALSESLRGSLGLQFTQMNGYLADHFNYVALFNAGGDPFFLVDEELPRSRTRWQLNGRLRWSPEVGVAIGFDASWYIDDWGLDHLAFEPNAELPLGEQVRWRTWYRLSLQYETTYFEERPMSPAPQFRTQDSDLGTWTMHSAGTLFAVTLERGNPAARRTGWEMHVSLLGFYRSDGIWALGGSIGAMATW